MILESLSTPITVRNWTSQSGQIYKIGSNVPETKKNWLFVSDESISMDSADIHFCQDLKAICPTTIALVKKTSTNGKQWKLKFCGKLVQLLILKQGANGISVYIDGSRVYNEKRADETFHTLADVKTYLKQIV